ncbi:hypothetical protein FED44_19320 [Microbispora fusca]|uniref:Uncharacterized protein n=1 Tax=Microbispora triticiradicis TaxID=2200763 RepID=A0A5R8YXA2_9ACTN|nr:hypothetical protein FED44_19320 [Microbispora fusca]
MPGGPRGLQNRRGRGPRPGGFDSRPPPLIMSLRTSGLPPVSACQRGAGPRDLARRADHPRGSERPAQTR